MTYSKRIGCVYLMHLPKLNVYKIGYSVQPQYRAYQLTLQHNSPVVLIACFYDTIAKAIEPAILNGIRSLFKVARQHGKEYFYQQPIEGVADELDLKYAFIIFMLAFKKAKSEGRDSFIHQFMDNPGSIIYNMTEFVSYLEAYNYYIPNAIKKYDGIIFDNNILSEYARPQYAGE